MKRLSLLLCLSLLLVSCGKKGPLQLPLERKPQVVGDVTAFQRGGRIILEWTNPTNYIDGRPLPDISRVEIWLWKERIASGVESSGMTSADFAKKAELEHVIPREEFPKHQRNHEENPMEFQYVYMLAGQDIGLETMVFSLRVEDGRRKISDFSSLLSIKPQVLPFPPQSIQSECFEDRVTLVWEQPAQNIDRSSPPNLKGYNVYRSDDGGEFYLINTVLVVENHYDDHDIIFGKVYRYFIRASASAEAPFLESEDSPVLEILPQDTFAPAPPAGIMVISGMSFLSLSWAANSEKDVIGYKVWRRGESEEHFALLTPQPIPDTAFNDQTVEKGRRYHYAISAVDGNGNESQRSETASGILKDARL